jgi:hypothetical protein
MDSKDHEDDLADDMLRGIPSIARYINEPVRRTYELAVKRKLPLFRYGHGGLWHARKSTLRQYIRKLEGGE